MGNTTDLPQEIIVGDDRTGDVEWRVENICDVVEEFIFSDGVRELSSLLLRRLSWFLLGRELLGLDCA